MPTIGLCGCELGPAQHSVRPTRETGSLAEVFVFIAWALEGTEGAGPKERK